MLPIKEIESLARERTRNVVSVTHDFGHLKRVAVGAAWFVKVLGGTKEEQDMAYAAGLLHDIVRPASEKVCHAKASARESEKILSALGVEKAAREKMVRAIRDHRLPVKWVSPLHQSIYLADKILEQMGALVAFRRCYYVGECADYRGVKMEEAFRRHFSYRMDRRMGRHMYEAARKRMLLEDAIKSYRPDTKGAERYKKEVTDYLNGRKFGGFRKLVTIE
jgi:HD superfamily phosphodiesterase